MRSFRVMVPAAMVGVFWAFAVPASAAIVQPTSGFTVPLNAQQTGPAPFLIKATGYSNGQLVFVNICDGTPASDPHWDAASNCDSGTAPVGVTAKADGTVTWDPAVKAQQIGIFDGDSPTNLFNCLYPGEPSPNNGNTDFTNCQIKVSTSITATSADQSFVTFALPVPPGGTTTTSTTLPATTTTTTTPGASTTTTVPATTTSSSSTTTTTTTTPGTTTTSSTSTTTSSSSSSSTSSTSATTSVATSSTTSVRQTTTTDPGGGGLAFAGANVRNIVGIGLVLLIMGSAMVGLHRRYRPRR